MQKRPIESVRKSVDIPSALWADIEDYRFEERHRTDNEALRSLLREGLRAFRQRTAAPVESGRDQQQA